MHPVDHKLLLTGVRLVAQTDDPMLRSAVALLLDHDSSQAPTPAEWKAIGLIEKMSDAYFTLHGHRVA
jgi:hypothetical protein